MKKGLRKALPALIIAVTGIALGGILGFEPSLIWVFWALLLGVVLVQFPPYVTAIAAVVAVVFSRLIVYLGLAPGLINFLHFPLALVAASLAALHANHRRGDSGLTVVGNGIIALAAVSFFSWVVNGGEILRPILTWLYFVEPFLLIYALAKSADARLFLKLKNLAIAIAIIQIPLALWQLFAFGPADAVQGTFIRRAGFAGAPDVGAIALLGLLVITAGVTSGSMKRIWLLPGALLFAVPIIADAKQAVVVFVPAAAFLLLGRRKIRRKTLLMATALFVFLWVAFSYYEPLHRATNLQIISNAIQVKVGAFRSIVDKASEWPGRFIIGLGPGNSVSRIALAAQPGYIRSGQASELVKLNMSPTTKEILMLQSEYYFTGSSASRGEVSWLGLFGDLGLIGVGIYIWVLVGIWKALSKKSHVWSRLSKAVLLMGVLLGAVYYWLEKPEFMIPWALIVSLGLTGPAQGLHPNSRQRP